MVWKIPDSVKAEQADELLEARHNPFEEREEPPCTVVTPQPYVVKQKKKTVAQLERETNGGRELPRPACPYDLIVDPLVESRGGRFAPSAERYFTQLKRDPRSCTTCTRHKRGGDCAGQCDVPGFWEARTMSPAEVRDHDARRAEKQKE